MNKIFLIGNLTRDPELTTVPSGVSVCKFAVAVSRPFTTNDGARETDFFNVAVWRAKGENCAKYLKKGSKAAIVGRVEIREYEKDGQKRTFTEVVADDVEFLTPKGGAGDHGSNDQMTPISDDSLPF